MSEVNLAALVEEIRTEARDMTEDGEDASVIRGWANTIAAHLRKATPPAAPDEAMVRDALRYRLIARKFQHMKTSEAELLLSTLRLHDADPAADLDTIIDAALTGDKA